MLDSEIKSKINKLWNAFWAGGLANPLTAIEQISYLIFMKKLDDLDIHLKNAALARGQSFSSVFNNQENCRWSIWKYYNAQDMYRHVSEVVFPFIKDLKNGEDVVYSKYMKDAVFMIPKPSLLQEAVTLLDEINIGERPDIQGDVYEHLLGELKTSGKNGQFRTPRHIIRMMVKLVDPEIGQKICDPACGTGGFLIAAYQHILKKYTSPEMIEIDSDGTPHNLIGDKIVDPKHWDYLWNETFYGYDFDITMIRISLMNMILHGIRNPDIEQIDSVSNRFQQKPIYDVILANPPFAGYIDKADINDNFSLETAKTELLFLELFYNLLEIGGKAAVIVPNGVLFGSSKAHKKIRRMLIERCQIEAIISMPSGVFLPYSGVGTSILIFTKGGNTNSVWFYAMKNDGYSLDQKRLFTDGKGDIPDIIKKFKNKDESEESKIVYIKEIIDNDLNLSPSRYIFDIEVDEEIDIDKTWNNIKEFNIENEIVLKMLSTYIKDIKLHAKKSEIPWKTFPLGSKVVSDRLKAGGTPRRTVDEYWNDGKIPFVKIEDITNNEKYLYDTDEKTTELGLENSSAWLVPSNSILYSMYASYGEPIINKIPVSTNQAILAIRPSKNIDLEYLFYSLKNIKPTLSRHLRSTTQKNLSATIIKKLEISVPSLGEQKSIVEILSKVDESISLLNYIITETEQLKIALMKQLLGRARARGGFR